MRELKPVSRLLNQSAQKIVLIIRMTDTDLNLSVVYQRCNSISSDPSMVQLTRTTLGKTSFSNAVLTARSV